MANFFTDIERNVIPNWRDLSQTSRHGELNFSHSSSANNVDLPSSAPELEEAWAIERNISVAAEILNFHLLTQLVDPIIRDAAQFVLDNSDKASKHLVDVAHRIHPIGLRPRQTAQLGLETDVSDIHSYLRRRIARFKELLSHNPRNAAFRIEKARLHTILGQLDKAKSEIEIALHLAPNNRYVVRSSVRFWLHEGSKDLARQILSRSTIAKHDPWVMASEIAVSTLLGRSSDQIRRAVSLSASKNFSPFDTAELTCALATVELHNGSRKLGRKLLAQALTDPNDNTLAQAEWLAQRDNGLTIARPIKPGQRYHEAAARRYYELEKYDMAFLKVYEWFKDAPFSRTPVLFGTHISTVFLKNYSEAISLGHQGLVSNHMDPSILNNMAYAACLANRLEEAKRYIDLMYGRIEKETDIIYQLATMGLFLLRTGKYLEGRKFYAQAVTLAQDKGLVEVMYLAQANLLREEAQIGQRSKEDIEAEIRLILSRTTNISTRKTAIDAHDLLTTPSLFKPDWQGT